jgi:hypothetical protein
MTPMRENSCLKLPQISNQLWCLKNEQHLNMDYNFDHQMSLSKTDICIETIVYIF